ncbi:unnamed protein product [Danaus chrysippus]|uniref:(African queen) hypothetical protein n=1 Tax=Danaus chrysippus TaxID=151541 RepID=A0A8J2R7Y2_9NEOP|nr:unnamed protein product [Danaus chrysippus]
MAVFTQGDWAPMACSYYSAMPCSSIMCIVGDIHFVNVCLYRLLEMSYCYSNLMHFSTRKAETISEYVYEPPRLPKAETVEKSEWSRRCGKRSEHIGYVRRMSWHYRSLLIEDNKGGHVSLARFYGAKVTVRRHQSSAHMHLIGRSSNVTCIDCGGGWGEESFKNRGRRLNYGVRTNTSPADPRLHCIR